MRSAGGNLGPSGSGMGAHPSWKFWARCHLVTARLSAGWGPGRAASAQLSSSALHPLIAAPQGRVTPALPGQDTARVFLHRWQGWSAGMVTCCSFLKILLISCAAMMPYDTRKSEIMGDYWRLSVAGCPVRSFSIPVEPSTVRDLLWGQNCRATSQCHTCLLTASCASSQLRVP